MGAETLNRLRVTVAALLLIATLWVVRGAPWPVWASGAEIALLTASGLIGFAFGDTWFFRSLVILGAGRATLLASLAPLFTTAIGWSVLGERLGPLALLGMAMAIGGVSLALAGRRGEAPNPHGSVAAGVFAGVLGALGQAAGFVLSRLALRGGDLDALSATVVRISAACLAIWVMVAVQRQVRATVVPLRDRRAAWFTFGGTFFGPFLGATLSLAALQFIEAGVAASIIAVTPILALWISARFHREPIGARQILGALVAVAGVVVLFRR